MQYYVLLLSALWAVAVSARAQGSFQNLGFESATLVPDGARGGMQFGPAFPGWSAYIGGVQQTLVAYNDAYLDTSGIGIIDRGFTNPYGRPEGVIEGNYTALLMAGVVNGPKDPEDVTLSQTSLVPVTAQSLWFKAFQDPLGPVLEVALGGERLSLVPMGSGTNYTLFAADIRSFSGQTAELDFTAIAERPYARERYVSLDSIQFSDQSIPEPSVSGLLAVGTAVLGWKLRRRLN
jgi:hypothetical protein